MEETSLDEFVEVDSENDEHSEGDDEGASQHEAVGSEVEPPTSTSRWVPAGRECECCEATVNRLWMDEDAVVCSDCKDWETVSRG